MVALSITFIETEILDWFTDGNLKCHAAKRSAMDRKKYGFDSYSKGYATFKDFLKDCTDTFLSTWGTKQGTHQSL